MTADTYLTERERAALGSVRVGIAGAGGLGSNCAMHLVRAGVRHLVVADFDVVCESNLNRQFYFRDQLGMRKVEALRANLFRIDPEADVRAVDVRLDAESAREVFADCDIVVEAFDAAEAKAMLVAALAGRRMVVASGIAGWGRSNAIRARGFGDSLVVVGDGESEVGEGLSPHSPRVGIAAAMQANAVVAMALGMPLDMV
jgi:sulfur carrier protein ThiS adenylyltransferase